ATRLRRSAPRLSHALHADKQRQSFFEANEVQRRLSACRCRRTAGMIETASVPANDQGIPGPMSEKVRVSGELSETLPGQAPAAVSGALRLPRAARAMTRWGRLALRSCLATGRPVIRHPWRTAAVVALLALIGFGALAAGVNFWVSDHLRASRAA